MPKCGEPPDATTEAEGGYPADPAPPTGDLQAQSVVNKTATTELKITHRILNAHKSAAQEQAST